MLKLVNFYQYSKYRYSRIHNNDAYNHYVIYVHHWTARTASCHYRIWSQRQTCVLTAIYFRIQCRYDTRSLNVHRDQQDLLCWPSGKPGASLRLLINLYTATGSTFQIFAGRIKVRVRWSSLFLAAAWHSQRICSC